MSQVYDCVIVGAGPAGGAAAIQLARAGRKVLVFEKGSPDRYKPCGGGTSSVISELLDLNLTPAISQTVNSICYTRKKQDPVKVTLETPEPLWMIRRNIFDNFLVRQAQKQGAEVRYNTEVREVNFSHGNWQLTTSFGQIKARFLIAADGAKGKMAKSLGFKDRKRQIGGAIEAEVAACTVNEHTAQFDFSMANGYSWNFPKNDGYSIGTGVFNGSQHQSLREEASEYALMFHIDLSSVQKYGHPLNAWNGNQRLHTENKMAVLAGEAACLVDPLTAEGIRPSIISGVLAAKAVNQAIAGNSHAIEGYTGDIRNEIGKDMWWARQIAKLLYSSGDFCYRYVVKQPLATQAMTSILSGKLRYRNLLSHGLMHLGKLFG